MKNKLTTNYNKVLEILYDNIANINHKQVSIITQIEITEQLGLSKIIVNSLFKELRDDGLIISINMVGRYYLSEYIIKIVEIIKSIQIAENETLV
jgi:DNA-binding transcriptional regulator LsrR (DeoR family)